MADVQPVLKISRQVTIAFITRSQQLLTTYCCLFQTQNLIKIQPLQHLQNTIRTNKEPLNLIMMPGPTLIVACGSSAMRTTAACKALFAFPTLPSGNTFGARIWTDGFMIAPRLPHPPPICYCPKCQGVFLLEHAKVVNTIHPHCRRGKTLMASSPPLPLKEPSIKMYFHLLEDKTAVSQLTRGNSREEEMLLRMRASWKYHDLFRRTLRDSRHYKMSDDDPGAFRSAQETNLNVLVDLLDQNIQSLPRDNSKQDNRAFKMLRMADALRELGRYWDALDILKDIPSLSRAHEEAQEKVGSTRTHYKTILESLCLSKDPFVYEFQYDPKTKRTTPL